MRAACRPRGGAWGTWSVIRTIVSSGRGVCHDCEPNGYLHIGHAKAICLNFGIARQFDGRCNLRMDDTNPAKEDIEYEDSIVADVRWLIAGWADDRLSLKPKGATATHATRDGHED